MYFLFNTVSVARGAQLTLMNVVYGLILLASTWGAYRTLSQIEGFGLYVVIPILALLLLWRLPSFSPSIQTVLGCTSVIVSAVLLMVALPPQTEIYSEKGMALHDWNLFRAYVSAIPCMCILLHIIVSNPNQRNLLLLGIPLVVCTGFSFYALRALLE